MFNDRLKEIVSGIMDNYQSEEILLKKPGRVIPNRDVIIDFLGKLRQLMFPGFFGDDIPHDTTLEYSIGNSLTNLKKMLCEQIYGALSYYDETGREENSICADCEKICTAFFRRLPHVQKMLMKDVQAAYDGDPAAQSKEDIILSYPGLFAVYVYRIAHELYTQKVPLIPRIMTEHAHSCTGIDINAGATIGEYFFMDHGTGIVIGETTIIGDHVKLYQGVTLGALSTKLGQQLSGVKRHPTIENNVTIYSNASVLGGNTVIGENAVIGGSSFITESIPANTKVSMKAPELTVKGPKTNEVWE